MKKTLNIFWVISWFFNFFAINHAIQSQVISIENQNHEYLEKLINSYAPSIYLGDNNFQENKNNYNTQELKQAALEEIYNIASYEKDLQLKKWLFSGYKTLEQKQIAVFITDDWKISPFSIIFHVYNTTKEKTINQLKKNLFLKKHYEQNGKQWSSRDFVEKKAQKYWQNIHHDQNFWLFVENEKVLISFKRLKFETWLNSSEKNRTVIIYFNYQKQLDQLKMIVNLDENSNDEKDQESDPLSNKVKELIAGTLTILIGFLATILIPSTIAQIKAAIFAFFKQTWEQIINSIVNSLGNNTPSETSIGEIINEKIQKIFTDKIKDEIAKKIKKTNLKDFKNPKIIEGFKRIENELMDNMMNDLNSMKWPKVPENDIVDLVAKKLKNVKVDKKWPQKISKIKEKVTIGVNEKISELADFTTVNIEKLRKDIDQETSLLLNEDLNSPWEEINDEIVTTIDNIKQEIKTQNKQKFSDNFESFLQNYIDKLKEELLNYTVPKVTDKILLKTEMTESTSSLIEQVFNKKIQTIGFEITTKILDDFLINENISKIQQALSEKCRDLYKKRWLDFDSDSLTYKNNILKNEELKIIILGKIKNIFFEQIWNQFEHQQIIFNQKIINRLKKAINNKETNLYKEIKKQNVSIFEREYLTNYYIYDLKRIFTIATDNSEFDLSNFLLLNNYFQTKLNNLAITQQWYQEKFLRNKNALQNIYKVLMHKIGEQIFINGNYQYLNFKNINIQALSYKSHVISVLLSHTQFPNQITEIKITVLE